MFVTLRWKLISFRWQKHGLSEPNEGSANTCTSSLSRRKQPFSIPQPAVFRWLPTGSHLLRFVFTAPCTAVEGGVRKASNRALTTA